MKTFFVVHFLLTFLKDKNFLHITSFIKGHITLFIAEYSWSDLDYKGDLDCKWSVYEMNHEIMKSWNCCIFYSQSGIHAIITAVEVSATFITGLVTNITLWKESMPIWLALLCCHSFVVRKDLVHLRQQTASCRILHRLWFKLTDLISTDKIHVCKEKGWKC